MNMTKIATLFVILAIIVGVLVIAFDSKQSKTKTPKQDPPTASTTLSNLAKQLAVKPEIRDSIYIDWIEEKNTVVPLSGKQFIIGTVDINGIGKYKGISDIENTTFTTMQPIGLTTDTFFTSNGFTSNTQNTKTYELEPAPYKTAGYENGDMKCLIRLDERTDPFGSFFCGTVDGTQIDLQKQMGSMLSYKATKDGITSFRVQKIEADYAIGTYSEAFTGYTWMAKKDGKAWKILWKSNDIAPCVDMERLGIPKSIYGNCYTPEG